MSRAIVEEEIRRFLASSKSEVLCLQGAWGTGKTYMWNQLLRQAVLEKNVQPQRYSYNSLFGINSLEHLKISIFENTVSGSEIGSQPSISTIVKSMDGILNSSRRFSGIIGKLPLVRSVADAFMPSVFLAVRNQIICIDDVERRGLGLSIRDILGLASFVKDQRNCKVILILNYEEMTDNSRDEFGMYLEKVIDTFLAFSPTSIECCDIALKGNRNLDGFLREFCPSLEIVNIRIIQRIAKLGERIQTKFFGHDDRLLREAIKTLTVLGWIEFGQKCAPPLDFVIRRGNQYMLELKQERESNEEEARWHKMLDQIEFAGMNKLDLALLDGVRNGFFDEQIIDNLVIASEQEIKNNDLLKDYREIWALYHDTLYGDQESFVNKFVDSFIKASHLISPINLDGSVILLKQLQCENQAMQILSHYMLVRGDQVDIFDSSTNSMLTHLKDEDVIRAFNEKTLSIEDYRSCVEVLDSLFVNGFKQKDLKRLTDISNEELIVAVKNLTGAKLDYVIERCLSAKQIGRPYENIISGKMREVISRISEESHLNACRLAKYKDMP